MLSESGMAAMTLDLCSPGLAPGTELGYCEQDQLGNKWGTRREGAGEPVHTQVSALVSVLQRGQGRQPLWHVVIELGQALLLVVFVCARLHCNKSHRVSPFS